MAFSNLACQSLQRIHVSVSLLHGFDDGDGRVRVSLFGLVPLSGDDTNPELNEGELLRYLAESIWYLTELLPGEGVRWDPIDSSTAEATVEFGGATATLKFYFTDEDEVSKVHAGQRPWSGNMSLMSC